MLFAIRKTQQAARLVLLMKMRDWVLVSEKKGHQKGPMMAGAESGVCESLQLFDSENLP